MDSIVNTTVACSSEAVGLPADPQRQTAPLHRLREVRRSEGITQRAMARRLNLSPDEVAEQENENTDLPLSLLYQWQAVLDVPVAELLVEPDNCSLSQPILGRARLVRLMRTVVSIYRQTRQKCIRGMAQRLFDQVVEIMPELREAQSWPSKGKIRRRDELGVAVERGRLVSWEL